MTNKENKEIFLAFQKYFEKWSLQKSIIFSSSHQAIRAITLKKDIVLKVDFSYSFVALARVVLKSYWLNFCLSLCEVKHFCLTF